MTTSTSTSLTVGDYLPGIRAALTPGSTQAWSRALDLMQIHWSDRELAQIQPSDVAALARCAQETARRRRHHQGASAAEHAVAAARHLFAVALKDGLVSRNVALSVPKPNRGAEPRQALSRRQIGELMTRASQHHERTVWMLRWYLETGSRREALLALRPGVVRETSRTVLVTEKGRKSRTLPVSSDLAAELADPASTLYGWTRRRLEVDWGALRTATGWGEDFGISSHWMRHTAITRMERASSFVVAAAWAGHAMSSVVTSTYVRVALPDMVCGWMSMTGHDHPLHDCEDARDCFVSTHRPELLTQAGVLGQAEPVTTSPADGRHVRLLRETA